MKRRSLLLILLALSSAASAGDAKSPAASNGDWEFSLSAGPAVRNSGSISFTGGSRSAGTFIPSFVGSNSYDFPPIGDENAYDQRTYNDGYVRTDGSTDVDGFTTNWGYQNSRQVNGDNLSFHATGYESIRNDTVMRSSLPTVDRREQSIAPIIQLDGHYKHEIAGFRPGFSASIIWSPVRTHQQWSDFSLSQARNDLRHDWTDVYNLGGFGSDIPSAPYAGNPAGPGFVLENIPDSRSIDVVQIGSENAVITNNVSTRFNADHTTLSFGPTMSRQIAPEWNFEAGMGLSLHWLHWSADQEEILTVSRNGKSKIFKQWNDKASGDQVLGGLYFQLATEWAPKQWEWSIKGLLRGDFGQTFSKQIGPSNISYDMDGITAAVLFSHRL